MPPFVRVWKLNWKKIQKVSSGKNKSVLYPFWCSIFFYFYLFFYLLLPIQYTMSASAHCFALCESCVHETTYEYMSVFHKFNLKLSVIFPSVSVQFSHFYSCTHSIKQDMFFYVIKWKTFRFRHHGKVFLEWTRWNDKCAKKCVSTVKRISSSHFITSASCFIYWNLTDWIAHRAFDSSAAHLILQYVQLKLQFMFITFLP